MPNHLFTNLLLITALISGPVFAAPKIAPAELRKIQDFHLQQAQEKLYNSQYAQAWGDYAYILCHIPNHYLALKQMSEIATKIDKQQDLAIFFEKALKAFPQDGELHALYGSFLFNAGHKREAKKHSDLARIIYRKNNSTNLQ